MPRSPNKPCARCGRLLWPTRGAAEDAPQICHPCRGYAPHGQGKPRRSSVTEWVCEHCGQRCERPRTKGQTPRYCGPRCQARAAEARRREARGEFSISDARRRRIYDRDGWCCQICGAPTSPVWSHVDLWSPTLDHIEPQSHSLIPDHSDTNLRTAHWLCNQLRSDNKRTDAEVRTLAAERRCIDVAA